MSGKVWSCCYRKPKCQHEREGLVGMCGDPHPVFSTLISSPTSPTGVAEVTIHGQTGKARCLDCGRIRLVPAEEIIARGLDV